MADTNFRGPIGAMGSLEVQGGTSASVEPLDGPSYFYQGVTFLDPRGAPFAKDGTAPGRVPAFMSNPSVILVDTIPQAAGTAVLAAVQVATAATPMTLTAAPGTNFSTGAASIAVGVPVIPAGTTTVTTAIALDFGFTTGTTTANSLRPRPSLSSSSGDGGFSAGVGAFDAIFSSRRRSRAAIGLCVNL